MNPLPIAAAAPPKPARTHDVRPGSTENPEFEAAFARASGADDDKAPRIQGSEDPDTAQKGPARPEDADLTGFGWMGQPVLAQPEQEAGGIQVEPAAEEEDAAPVPLFAAIAEGLAVDVATPQDNTGPAPAPAAGAGGSDPRMGGHFGAAWTTTPDLHSAAERADAQAAPIGPAPQQEGSAAPRRAAELAPVTAPGQANAAADPVVADTGRAADAAIAQVENTAQLGAVIVMERNAAAATADLGMNLWADRLRAEAPAEAPVDPVPEAEPEAEAEQTVVAAQQLGAQTDGGSDMTGGDTPEQASTPTTTVSKPEDSAARFQIPTATVDTSSSPGEATAENLHNRPTAKVAVAVEEIIRGRSSLGETDATARVEIELDGQRISVRVQVRDGRVDVEIAGMDPAELAALKDDLGERLRGHELTLGDLTQDTGNGPHHREEARDADATNAAPDEVESAADKNVEAARLRHDGAVYVTA